MRHVLLLKKIRFELFNRSFGIVIRGIRRTFINNTPPGVHYQVKQRAIQDSADYAISHFSGAMMFNTRPELWDFCLTTGNSLQNRACVIAEYGVWKGESINFFARSCPKAVIYGFDSFEGLEEDWHGFTMRRGTFSTSGKQPQCEKNVKLVKGWIEDTMSSFLIELQRSQIQILHIDVDTYKPTSFVLNSLVNNLGKGSIIIFDEFFGYPGFKMHEFKAWHEFVNSNNIQYKYLAYTEMAVAVEIV